MSIKKINDILKEYNFEELRAILEKYETNIIFNYNWLSLAVTSDSPNFYLYIRFNKDTISIANISLTQTRIGIGRKIFKCIENLASVLNIPNVTIENILTDEMWDFSKKNGYKRLSYSAIKAIELNK